MVVEVDYLEWFVAISLARYFESGRMESPKHMLHIMLVLVSTGGQLLFPGTNQTSYAHNSARKYSHKAGRDLVLKIRSGINQLV